MKTTHFIFGILIVGLVLMGCDQQSGPTTGVPFIGGETGVRISLRANFPPEEVFDSGEMPFDIIVVLKNDGEFQVPSGESILTLSGIAAEDFSRTPGDFKITLNEALEPRIRSVQGSVIDSPEIYVEINDLNYHAPLDGDFSFPLRAELCYLYGTKANTGVCFKENLLTASSEICEVDETKTVYNSGAPVQIENFIEYPRGRDKIGFSFDIVKKGNGRIFRDTVQDCKQATPMQENEVFVEVLSDLQGITCRPLRGGDAMSGYVRLNDVGSATIDCDQTAGVSGDFEKVLSISLRYRYSDDISRSLVVKHVPQN